MVLNNQNQTQDDLIDRIVYINRVAKVVAGGRRFHFTALVVVGDGKGWVGVGYGKAAEVPEAIKKATERARRDMVKISIVEPYTLPHETVGEFGSAKVVMKPACEGTGVIAGGVVRAIMECVGVHNILTKVLGSTNPHNVIKATMTALMDLTTIEESLARRGKTFSGKSRTIKGHNL